MITAAPRQMSGPSTPEASANSAILARLDDSSAALVASIRGDAPPAGYTGEAGTFAAGQNNFVIGRNAAIDAERMAGAAPSFGSANLATLRNAVDLLETVPAYQISHMDQIIPVATRALQQISIVRDFASRPTPVDGSRPRGV